jgi:alkylation response protein AidB-like acyl-CoA dehydrogenase
MDLCILQEEMGRAVLPGPFYSAVMLAAESVLAAGNESQKKAYLQQIAMGERRGTLALFEPDGGPRPGYIRMQARADGDAFVLQGEKIAVPDAHVSDFMVCVARTRPDRALAEGVTLFLVDTDAAGVSITPLVTMDGSRKQSAVTFAGVRIPKDAILGEIDHGWGPLTHVLQRASVGLAAENVGGAQKTMEIAVDYAKIRIAFGQPIGGFQAIKHMCADMLVDVESSRSIMYYAAWAVEEESPETAALAASVAKSHSSEAFYHVAANCIQVLGGIGMTWEHDAQLYLKRAQANRIALGDTDYDLLEVAKLIGCR